MWYSALVSYLVFGRSDGATIISSEVNSEKPRTPRHRDHGVEDALREASAIARLIPAFFVCYFLQGEHSKNFFQKEKVLYTSATKTGEFYLRLLCFLFLAISALKSFSGWRHFATCINREGRAWHMVERKRKSEPGGSSLSLYASLCLSDWRSYLLWSQRHWVQILALSPTSRTGYLSSPSPSYLIYRNACFPGNRED